MKKPRTMAGRVIFRSPDVLSGHESTAREYPSRYPVWSFTMFKVSIAAVVASCAISSSAFAGVCDYRPSQMIGGAAATAVAGSAGAAAAAGGAAKAAGVYTLVHATSGATMIGGTWAGASAAGTAGIIGGTAGVLGTTVAVITAPVTIVAAGVTAATVAAYEGACYFTDTRITDYAEVDTVITDIAATAPEKDFRYNPGTTRGRDGTVWVNSPDGGDRYDIADLYIENGVLKVSKWGFDRVIGVVSTIDATSAIAQAPAH